MAPHKNAQNWWKSWGAVHRTVTMIWAYARFSFSLSCIHHHNVKKLHGVSITGISCIFTVFLAGFNFTFLLCRQLSGINSYFCCFTLILFNYENLKNVFIMISWDYSIHHSRTGRYTLDWWRQTTQSTPGTGAFQESLHPPEGPSQEVQTGDFHIVIQQSFYSHGQKFR